MSKRINIASEALTVPEDELNEFELEDPFNKGHLLSGFISRRGDHRYGAVLTSLRMVEVSTIKRNPYSVVCSKPLASTRSVG